MQRVCGHVWACVRMHVCVCVNLGLVGIVSPYALRAILVMEPGCLVFQKVSFCKNNKTTVWLQHQL